MDRATGFQRILELATINDKGRHRHEMLELARQLASDYPDNVAMLWMLDTEKQRLHLDHFEPMDSLLTREELTGISIPFHTEQSTLPQIVRLTHDAEPLSSKLVEYGYQRRRYYPVTPASGFGGFLQIATKSEQKPPYDLLDHLATVIAGRIARHRDLRHLRVYERLRPGQADEGVVSRSSARTSDSISNPFLPSTDAWLARAASVARDETNAEVALVLRPTADLQLEVVAWNLYGNRQPRQNLRELAASDESLVRRVFDRKTIVRILNHRDATERHATFGTTSCDSNFVAGLEIATGVTLRSWIASAVLSNNQPVALLFVANKHSESADGYLPGVFSKTDEDLVRAICDVTSKGVAQSLLTQATKEINELTSTAFDETPDTRSELIEVLRRHIPGVLACSIAIYDSRELVTPEDRIPLEILEYGAVNQDASQQLKLHVKAAITVSRDWVLRYDLPMVSQTNCAVLYLLCRRPILAQHEQDAIRFLTLNLAQHVRSELKLRDEIESLIQIRHAIRSGLQGVQHLDNAWEVYEQIARNGLQPADFRVAMLRKSLQWARLFAERTRTLLEESRFLLSYITREKLKLAKSSIVTVVTEAIACLRIDAEDRNIEIRFQNDIRDTVLADVVMDRFLMEIAVFNILDNAVKYAYRDTYIFVRLAATGAVWVLAVQDHGEYIPPDDYKAIFRPLVRRPNRHNEDTRGGTGLGLAVVKDIIEAHGGRDVEVASIPIDRDRPEKAATTTFTLCVPRHITKKTD